MGGWGVEGAKGPGGRGAGSGQGGLRQGNLLNTFFVDDA